MHYLCAMIRILLAFIIISSHHLAPSFAQSTEKLYPAEGVYGSFSAFRNGIPDVVKSSFVKPETAVDYTIRQWVNSENMYYLDASNVKQSYDPKNFWGFVEKGTLYVFLGNKFHKINTLGQINYFLESYPVIKGNMAPVVTDARATSAYRLLDMETGDIMDYTADNLLDLLERDEILYLEFKSIISMKERKKKMFIYMERFNSKYPLERVTTDNG